MDNLEFVGDCRTCATILNVGSQSNASDSQCRCGTSGISDPERYSEEAFVDENPKNWYMDKEIPRQQSRERRQQATWSINNR
jgi:hypothetical protein